MASPIFVSSNLGSSYSPVSLIPTVSTVSDVLITSSEGVPYASISASPVLPLSSVSSTVDITIPTTTLTPLSPFVRIKKRKNKRNNIDPSGDSVYIPSINLSYSEPVLSVYENLNSNSSVRDRIIKYVKFKTLDKWLYDDLNYLLGYLKVSGNKVKKSKSKSSVKKDSDSTIDKKVDYIEDNILTNKFVYKVITKYIDETNTNWYNVPKNDYYVREAMEEALKKELRK